MRTIRLIATALTMLLGKFMEPTVQFNSNSHYGSFQGFPINFICAGMRVFCQFALFPGKPGAVYLLNSKEKRELYFRTFFRNICV